jgi:hypothetical protein
MERLVRRLHSPARASLFERFLHIILARFSEIWSSDFCTDCIAFIILDRLSLILLRDIETVNIKMPVIEQLLAFTMFQRTVSRTHIADQDLRDKIFFLAVHHTFKLAENEGFVQFSGASREAHLRYVCPPDVTEEHQLLADCANNTRWALLGTAQSFIEAMKGRFFLPELRQKLDFIDTLQPQPLLKIRQYFETDIAKVNSCDGSALEKVVHIVQWIGNIRSACHSSIFMLFQHMLHKLEGFFLCIPRDILVLFIKSFPKLTSLPSSILSCSRIEVTPDWFMSRDASELQVLSRNIATPDADSLIQPFLTLTESPGASTARILPLSWILENEQ